MGEVSIKPFEPRDLAGVLGVLGQSMTADPISEQRFTRQVLLDANFKADGAPVARDGDQVVGFCLSLARQVPLENAAPDLDRGYITLMGVAPSHQRRGIGRRLLEHAEDYLKSQKRKVIMIASYAPGYFIPGVDIHAYQPALRFFDRFGYKEVYRPLAMQTDLSVPRKPDGGVLGKMQQLICEGVIIETWSPQIALPLIEFVQREFPGDWVRVVRETSQRILGGESPGRLIGALASGIVVGFSHYDGERFGPIGVAASQRGRCLGQLLMYSTLEKQSAAGFKRAWFLWSDDKTAQRLYNAAGFEEMRRFALLRKEF